MDKNQKPAAKKANTALAKPMKLSPDLAAVVGATELPRTEVTKQLWAYIKQHGLQDATNKRQINADDKLAKVFGKSKTDMFEMTKLVNKHMS